MAFLKIDGGDHAPPSPILWPACLTPRPPTGRSTQNVQAHELPGALMSSAQSRRTKLNAVNARQTPAPVSGVGEVGINPAAHI